MPRGIDPSCSAPRTSRRHPAVPGSRRTGAWVTATVPRAASAPASTALRSITPSAALRMEWPRF